MASEPEVKLFRVPKTLAEVHELQRDTTELLRIHRRKVALNKLYPRRTPAAVQEAGLTKFKSERELLVAAGEPSPDTARMYRQRGRELFESALVAERDVWAVVADRSNTPGSWYTARAALNFYLVETVTLAKRAIDGWFVAKAKGPVSVEDEYTFKQACKLLPAAARALSESPYGRLPDKLKSEGRVKRPTNSKSASLRSMPNDWREQVAASLTGNRQLLYLIECVAGCRPKELKKGVTVLLRDDGDLELIVVGAKLGKDSGQPFRRIVVAASSGVAARLAKLLTVGTKVSSKPLIGAVDTYRKAIARAGAKVFPRRNVSRQVTAYSVRHQFKNNIRDAGFNRTQVAEAMGHVTTKSAAYYGTRVPSGAGGVTPRSVEATRKVKLRQAHPSKASPAGASVKSHAPSSVRRARKPWE